MKIMLTGFEPFGGESVNPAYEAIKLLPDKICTAQLIKLEIPTVFEKSGATLEKAIKSYQPEVVICVGQAGGCSGITIEKVAINLQDARIPDNEGFQPIDKPIKTDGENAYFSSLPVKAMVTEIRKNGIPAFLSYTAGTFVCNTLMYTLLYLIDKKYPQMRGGFIHVPYASQQAVNKPAGTASMSLETISRGLECSIHALLENQADISVSMGTIF